MNCATESQIHMSIVSYLQTLYGDRALVHHSRNEGNRGGRKGALDGARGKKMGVLAGFPDLLIILPDGKLIFMEVKTAKGRLTQSQAEVLKRLNDWGHSSFVVRSVEDAAKVLAQIKEGSNELLS